MLGMYGLLPVPVCWYSVISADFNQMLNQENCDFEELIIVLKFHENKWVDAWVDTGWECVAEQEE